VVSRHRLAIRARACGLGVVACTAALAVLASMAPARPATGGVGRFGGAIDWVEWGNHGQSLNLGGPNTRTSVTTFAGHTLEVSCTISNYALELGPSPGIIQAYRSGAWQGDSLDDLYNIGGTQADNTLINGLAVNSRQMSFDFSCSATLDGNAYPLEGLVFADAEQSGNVEFVQGTIPATATWRLIDRFRASGCTADSRVQRTVAGAEQTLRLDNPPSTLCPGATAGPAGVAFADGATAGRITVRGGGVSAVALGAVVTFDHSDAPASYGEAAHTVQYPFSGGVPPVGDSALFGGNTLADTTQPALRLGPSVDPEGEVSNATATADDTNPDGAFGPGDDETEAPPASILVDRGDEFTHTVSCTGAGFLAGWIDWNGNGTFDAGERAGDAICAGGTASLTWTVPPNAVTQAQSFMRLRYAASAAEVADPAGLALSGEVEDHAFAINLVPDLVVTKTAAPAVVEPGGQVTWMITVRNLGPGPSSGSTLTDTIPVGITNVSTSTPGCTVGAAAVNCTIGPLAVDGSTQITITGTAPSTTSTCFTNTATATQADDRDTTNNTAEASACTRPPLANVRITKSATPTTVLLGNQVRYLLTVINDGPDPAENVQVTDAPGAGIAPQSATPSQGTCATASSCNLGTIGPSGQATIEIVATTTALGTQGNTATVATSTAETNPADNTASETIVVEPQADLRLSKEASATELTEGDDFTYTIEVRNDGPATAADAVVTDSVPAGVTIRSVSTTRGSCTQGDPIVCQLGDLAVDATATITVEATATTAGTPSNTAIVASPTPDPNPNNNSDGTQLLTVARADLSITKTASEDTVLVGESLTFTLVVRNDGPSAAVNTVVTDRIPDGLRLDAATSPCAGAPTVVCELGTLARGAERTIRLTVTPTRAGAFPNTASVTSETPDDDPSNNLDDASVEAGLRADLALDKSVSAETVNAGQTAIYGLVVTNKGPHDAADVTLTDPVPAGMRLVSVTPSAGSCAGTEEIVCALGDVANGASVTIRIEVVAERAGSTRNVAIVNSTTPDPDPKNNVDETSVTTDELADLAITKTATLGTRNRSGARAITYEITVRNNGPSAARGVRVTDGSVGRYVDVAGVTASTGSCTFGDDRIVLCRLGDLAAGASATITITGTTRRSGRIRNAASVIGETPTDPDPGNNSTGVTTDLGSQRARITVAKRASRARAAAGDRVRYRIVVRNRGGQSARNVRVCDRLPAGLAYISRRGSKLRRGQACWTVRLLGPRSSRTFRVTARVLGGRTKRLVNTARAKGSNTRTVRDGAAVRRHGGSGRGDRITG
jgi:uncharacterized repeat protein (TIGR01451 family)